MTWNMQALKTHQHLPVALAFSELMLLLEQPFKSSNYFHFLLFHLMLVSLGPLRKNLMSRLNGNPRHLTEMRKSLLLPIPMR
jgi:hypothetical protein